MRIGCRPWAAAILAAGMLAGCRACKTDDIGPEGSISEGSAAPPGPEPTVRLLLDPGNPLAAVPVANRVRARLRPLGIDDKRVTIAGDRIHADVPPAKADACSKALQGGRLDVFLFDERADPFDANPAEHGERFDVKSEVVRGDGGEKRNVHYLMGTPEERDALMKYLVEHSSGPIALLGPVYAGHAQPQRLRSYYVQPTSARRLRGEALSSAKAKEHGDGAQLTLAFEGQGVSFVRWASKQRARFVVLVDEQVIATSQPDAEIGHGKLEVDLEPRDSAATSLTAATAIAKELDGLALSREVRLEGKKEP